jgi:hypothetical protein
VAELLSYLRCVVHKNEEYGLDYSIGQREVPRRAVTALSNLARGHALLKGRNYISMEDVMMIVKTATDSARSERVSLFSLLLANNGELTTNQILMSLNVSRSKALDTMAELDAIELVEMQDQHEDGQNNISKKIVLNPRFNWLLDNSMIKKVFPRIEVTREDGEVRIKDKTKGHEREILEDQFWAIYNECEIDSNGKGRMVNHEILQTRLIASGKFYAGDATQITKDMVKVGKLKVIDINQYKKVNQSLTN